MRISSRGTQGFTLIELMIVVVIVAILASIAYPSYRNHIIKTRRVAGAGCLMELSQGLERHYTTKLSYTGAALPGASCANETSKYYGYALNVAEGGRGYVITASPTGNQPDGKCDKLSINQTGTKTKTGTGTLSECW